MNDILTIAIDGPAGAGKSTIAKRLAKDYEIVYVDTGAMYRSVALYMMEHDINLDVESAVVEALSQVHIRIVYKDDTQNIYLNEEDVTQKIRQQSVGEGASKVSAYLPVRKKMVMMQQEMAKKTSLVMDGRDIGTHVLTDARVKIFLSADVMIRAKRRFNELIEKGASADLQMIANEIKERDHRDMNREHAPLVQAKDAHMLDTSNMSIDEVVDEIKKIIEMR
ncbi:(d)CMP kinase [Petrocella sp. FN5]|uniref:(d)CMP kinase n=1 Tax=Petrocella sp. FN5 TaxID=3032002 RepID=UPI0023DBB3DE|nr:(d)CMP kinase [Petrocella sp. FN5]MDF1617534.1 (d)CMP kinase [Petrocella sp. FN5]